jgi:Holliday junction DNA helicase RuvA
MIATLNGKVSQKLLDVVVLDVQGVGYGVLTIAEDYSALAVDLPAKLYIYEHIRESAHDLYGFCKLDTKQLFEQLLSVNGVGPRMALNILSIGTGQEVRSALATGDTAFIQRAVGVGKRVAERVVVDLKDKVGLDGVELARTGMLQSEQALSKDEAVVGLMSLGYTAQDAAKSLQDIDTSLTTEERITRALKGAA